MTMGKRKRPHERIKFKCFSCMEVMLLIIFRVCVDTIPYSGKFSLVQNFAELPSSPSEEIFVALNFSPVPW